MEPFSLLLLYVFVVWNFTRLITRMKRSFLGGVGWGGGDAYLDLVGEHSAPICLQFDALYWSLGRRGYFGVWNVALFIFMGKGYGTTPHTSTPPHPQPKTNQMYLSGSVRRSTTWYSIHWMYIYVTRSVVVYNGMLCYSNANKIFAVLRCNCWAPLSGAMGCIGELRAGSHSAGYEWFGMGNITLLALLVPITKPATHSRGHSNQQPHCTFECIMWVGIESL